MLQPGGGAADAARETDAGSSHTDGLGNLPEGCAMAADIFGSRGCATLCHNPTIAPSVGGFDMKTPGWEQRLGGAGPPSTAPDTNACKNKGPNYLNRTQPARGLFLAKLSPGPASSLQMPRDRDGDLTDS